MKKLIVIFLIVGFLFSCQKKSERVAPEIAQKYLQELKKLPQNDKSIIREFISLNLSENDWIVSNQKDELSHNIIGSLNPEREKRIAFASYYDIENDENQGALALLLSLSELINLSHQHQFGIDLIFFDNHNSKTDSLKYRGAKLFAQQHDYLKENKMIFLQKILGKNLLIKIDANSHKKSYNLVELVWRKAYQNGISAFSSDIVRNDQNEQTVLSNYGLNSILIKNYLHDKDEKETNSTFMSLQLILLEMAYAQN